MSFNRSDYIIYGWKLPCPLQNNKGKKIDLWNDKYLPFIEGHKGVQYTILKDDIAGRYVIFGLKIKSNSFDGWNFCKLEIPKINIEEVKLKFIELFNFEPIEEPYLFIHSHYS